MENGLPRNTCAKPDRVLSRLSASTLLISLCLAIQPVAAQEFLEDTFLLDVSLGSARSQIARDLSDGGYELADGTPINFSDWYDTSFPELNVLFLTELTPRLGLAWGLSTGERGEKYRIDPGIWIGFIQNYDLTKKSRLTISALTLLGGNFRERSCVGDYGDIGGIQSVNCRLAASLLPPTDTLNFLVREPGFIETRISIRYQLKI
jgi:hypothetical protein